MTDESVTARAKALLAEAMRAEATEHVVDAKKLLEHSGDWSIGSGGAIGASARAGAHASLALYMQREADRLEADSSADRRESE